MSAILGRTTVSLQDILDLEVGDVVRLDSFHDEPIELEIEGTKVFKAQIGKIKGFHGVKVVKKDEELLEKILIEKKVFKIISQNKKNFSNQTIREGDES